MNIHHLELFYYVAKHGGIMEAVRNIPYGIQQPAMSSQVIQLEEFLGVTLFHRRPFSLTAAGADLFTFIQPFFENLGPMADKIRGGVSQHIRIGASEVVLRDYLPQVLRAVRKKFPKMKLTLRQGYQPELEALVQNHGLDLAITLLVNKPPPGTRALSLFKLPLVLLVPVESPLRSAAELWKQDRIEQALISLPTNESICKHFQKGLAKLGVDWFTSIEVSTIDLVETYVAKGYGLGLSIAIPKSKPKSTVRTLPLGDFDPVTFGVLTSGKPTPIIQSFLKIVEDAAQALTV
jgi:DNA-binding transcriptional LysR family regulator